MHSSYYMRVIRTCGIVVIHESCCFVFLDSPPPPNLPYSISVGSTWVTLGWNEPTCDGGHGITEFILRYQKEVPDYYVSSYIYVYGISSSQRNYTIHNLEASTSYEFSVQFLSAEFQPSQFSDGRIITTLRPGLYVHSQMHNMTDWWAHATPSQNTFKH